MCLAGTELSAPAFFHLRCDMNVIELTNFSAYYKLKKDYLVALDNVSLTVEKGDFITLVGPSGCGKTTLLKCILNQMELTGGELLLMGEAPTTSVIQKANIAYISQDTKLYPHLNIFENIAFPLRMAETAPEDVDIKVRTVAEKCGIGRELLNRKPSQLSLGQQQRVALARAFVKRPEIILADEPFSHLDTPLRAGLQALLRAYHDETEATILFVTHDEEEAAALGDKRLRMGFGVIEAVEDTSKISLPSGKKVTGSLSDAILQKRKDTGGKAWRNKLLYRWPLILLGLVAVVFLGTAIGRRLTAPAPNEKLSVCLVGQNFNAEAMREALYTDMGRFTEQELRDLTVEMLYNENGSILAETLTARILDGVDLFILEEDYVFDGLGENYFAPIPKDVVDKYFPGAALYSEAGQIYAIRLDKDGGSRFSEFYGGNETCLLFINAASVNTGAMNGRGEPEDTAALELASYLWREGK